MGKKKSKELNFMLNQRLLLSLSFAGQVHENELARETALGDAELELHAPHLHLS